MTALVVGVLMAVACSGTAQPVGDDPAPVNVTTTEPGSTTTAVDPSSTTTAADPAAVLVFHRTAGYRHGSIEDGIAALIELGESQGFTVVASEDPTVFSEPELSYFDVVVFLSTTGDILDEGQQAALEAFIAEGNGYVGVHAAADTEYEWAWYGGLVGAYFESHPEPQEATVHLTDPSHPVVEGLPLESQRFDEWYNFASLPGPEVTVLAVLDETTYEGGTMGDVHPIIWLHEYRGGRAVYTGFGHTSESYDEPAMRRLLLNAILWTAGDG